VLAAAAMIGLLEAGYSAVTPSAPVERADYANWNFNSAEPIHKVTIYEKLADAVERRPDIIQIGDSSGFHGIVPHIVEQYLGGFKYANLSCCANSGFDGYYAIMSFMLRHVPSIKAVVLYMTLNNPPRDPAMVESATVGGIDRVRNAFGPLAPFTLPPTLASRPAVVRSVYTLGGELPQTGLQPFGDSWPQLVDVLRANEGWWPEHDTHVAADKQVSAVRDLCSPTGARVVDDQTADHTRDILGARRSYMEVELRRLADLAQRANVKLIVLIQPYPCQAWQGNFLAARQKDIAAIAQAYPNVIVPDPELFEPWPARLFSSPDHVRAGNEEEVSRRAGPAIATALGLPPVAPSWPIPGPPATVWSSENFAVPPWRAEGVRLARRADARGTEVSEAPTNERHFIELSLPDIAPNTYVVSFDFEGAAARYVYADISPPRAPTRYQAFTCNASKGQSVRGHGVTDSDIEQLSDRTFRCWGRFRWREQGAVLQIGLSRSEHNRVYYQGDEKTGIVLRRVDLQVIDGGVEK
jgi:hypothetical protein